MKKISFLLFAAFAALMFACGGGEVSPNGYKYVKHTNATGDSPKVGDYGFVHISVYQDDSLINSTYQMGRTAPIQVPDLTTLPADKKGVGKANPVYDILGMMKVGDSITVDVPIDSTMRQQSPRLKDAKRLFYGVVLMEIKTKEQYDQFVKEEQDKAAAQQQAAAPSPEEQKAMEERAKVFQGQEAAVAKKLGGIVKDYLAGTNKSKIKTTASGLKYLILEEGKGAQASAGKTLETMYYGVLPNGQEFDNSFKKGNFFTFTVAQSQVIQGWHEGFSLLKEGSKAVLFIPAKLGWGDEGYDKIPPKSETIFYVELHKVK